MASKKTESLSPSVNALQALRLKPPKSFSPAFVTDVYGAVTTFEDIHDLLASGYFKNIAWKFFHADVTNNHLELILLMAFYEFEFLNMDNCLKEMAKDHKKLGDLLLRALQSTLRHQETNFRLEASVFLFLSSQVRYNSSTLLQCKLYCKWIKTVSERFVSQISAGSEDLSTAEHLLYFAICGSIFLEEIKSVFRPLRISARLAHGEVPHSRILKLASMLSSVLYEAEDGKPFIEIRIALRKHGVSCLNSVVYAPSRYDVDREKLITDLSDLPQEKLEEIAASLGYEGVKGTDILPHVITEIVSGHSSPIPSSSDLTEREIFDELEENEACLFVPPLRLPTTKKNILRLLKDKAVLELSRNINTHGINCLGRLTITDPANENGIRGSSKYFLKPLAISVEGASAKISTKKPMPDMAPGERVMLLEMQKPNKFDLTNRMRKYGIFTARISRVTSISAGGSFNVVWKFPGFEKRFNAILRLPQNFTVVETLENVISESGEDSASLSSEVEDNDLALNFAVEGIAYETLLRESQLLPPKKRKTESGPVDVIDYNRSKVELRSGKANLTGPQAKILLDMVTSKSIHVPGDPSKFFPVVEEYLRVLSQNWAKERCLIVVPHLSAVQLLPLSDRLRVLRYRDPSAITKTNRLKADYLSRVAKLAAHLELEEYNFERNVRTALMFYHCHVKPRWENYLGQLKPLKESASKYPFSKMDFGNDSLKDSLLQVVDHYASVKGIFSQLQQLAPLSLDPSDDDIHLFLAHNERYVVASVEDAATLSTKFERVIVLAGDPGSVIPALRSKPSLLAVLGIGYLPPTEHERVWGLDLVDARDEIARLYGEEGTAHNYNPGLKFAVQNITVPPSPKQVNIEEAKYCVYLFQYLRLLGYPHHVILIAVWSPYMHKLIEEILEEQKIAHNSTPCDDRHGFRFGWPIIQLARSVFPADYLIVSTHGSLSFRGWDDSIRAARFGLYTVGASGVGKIKSGPFELYTGGIYGRETDDRENSASYVMEDSEHMGDYIRQMTHARTAQ